MAENEQVKIERAGVIREYIDLLKNKARMNNNEKLEIIQIVYSLLKTHYYCNKGKPEDLTTQAWVGRINIVNLLPILDYIIHDADTRTSTKAFELYQLVWALASRTSLEHFIDYMEWDRTSKVLASRRQALKPFIYYLTKQEFDNKLEMVVASYPPSYR